jgi:glutamate---cysteine ligase / carboxylate-amine ligase
MDHLPTIGVELEYQLVDAGTMALVGAAPAILADLPGDVADRIKPEFETSAIEVVSRPALTTGGLLSELEYLTLTLQAAAARQGVRLIGLGTHPTSHWKDQRVTPGARYERLVQELGDAVLRTVTFGLHVHVGCPSADAMIATCRRLTNWAPLLIALSGSSPYWCGRDTGAHSYRTEVCDPLPPGGPMPPYQSYAEYQADLDRWIGLGIAASDRDVWWDVRPTTKFLTAEVRVCDMVPTLTAVEALASLIQCLASPEVTPPDCDETVLRVARNRAAQHGPAAAIPAPGCCTLRPAREILPEVLESLRPVARRHCCTGALQRLDRLVVHPWSEVVRRSIQERGPVETLRGLAL